MRCPAGRRDAARQATPEETEAEATEAAAQAARAEGGAGQLSFALSAACALLLAASAGYAFFRQDL